MSKHPEFITELIRAANKIGELEKGEILRLLGRAYVTILEGREQAGIPLSGGNRDAAIDAKTATGLVETLSDGEVRVLLLDAAEMIRTLKIVLDAKDEVLNEGKET